MKTQCEYRNLEDQKQEHPEAKSHSSGKEFRDDIALLRAFAILAVLGYHFWPSVFPLGFIGVDVFFVISGYLIMALLQRSRDPPHRVLIDFYYRRLKRIVPLYYLVMVLIGCSMFFVYTAVWAERYFRLYFGAIFFYSNFDLLQSEGDYFADTTEKMPFLHTWSLGVEMQFYLVAPFLFFLSKLNSKKHFGTLILIGCFLSSLYFFFNTVPIASFYHPLARMWQFLAGMLASLYTERAKRKLHPKEANLLSSICLIISSLIFLPPFFNVSPPSFFQVLITIASAGFFLTAAKSTLNWSRFRLGYIAKISYALYLIHFPVLRFDEYLVEFYEKEIYVSITALLITFLVSTIVHHCFETPFLRAGKRDILLQTFKYFAFCFLIGWKWEMIVHPDCVPSTIIAANSKFKSSFYPLSGGHYAKDEFSELPHPFGHYVYEGNTGQLKIVIFGNSWAAQEAHLIRKIFPKNETAQMHLFSHSSAAFGMHGTNEEVKKHTPFLLNLLREVRPDYVFVLMRYNWKAGDLEPYEGPKDRVLDTYWQGIQNISQYAKKIFIQTHQPFGCLAKNNDFLNRFLDGLRKKKKLDSFHQPFNSSEFYNSPVHQRLKVLIERCTKCHLIDISEAFIDHKRNLVLTYDAETSLAYFDNQCHMTAPGLKMIEKPFRLAIEEGLNGKRRKSTVKPKIE